MMTTVPFCLGCVCIRSNASWTRTYGSRGGKEDHNCLRFTRGDCVDRSTQRPPPERTLSGSVLCVQRMGDLPSFSWRAP